MGVAVVAGAAVLPPRAEHAAMTDSATDRSTEAPEASGDASHRIVFTPSGLSGTVAEGDTVLDAARALGVDLDSVCGGRGLCGRCQITPSEGEFSKWNISAVAENLSPWDSMETEYKGRRKIESGSRLGCAARVRGDVVIDVPPQSQIHKQVVRKEVNIEGLEIDPIVSLHYVEIMRPDLDDGTPIADRVSEALAIEWQITDVTVDPRALRPLQEAAAADEGKLTVALHSPPASGVSTQAAEGDHGASLRSSEPPENVALHSAPASGARRIIAAYGGYVDQVVGMAVDIGSTTVAGHLCDLATGEVLATAGRMNPQIRFGEDLMSRVSYVMMNPGGDDELTAAVRTALDELLGELCDEAEVDRAQVLDIVLVGNPIMHHLALGFDSVPLGQSPFPLATALAVNSTARDLGIYAPASLYFGPCIAGHVGADTAGAILSERPFADDDMHLLIDVGTNAEIVLGNSTQLFAASSPTGPAFEGAQITAGQRATAGAIERVRIDPDTLEPRIRVIGSELWSDEPGFAESVAKTGVTGICGSGIIEVVAEMFLAGIIDAEGVVRGELAERNGRIIADDRTFSYVLHRPLDGPTSADASDILVTQPDIRAIQLAKAALRAGIDLLLEHAGLTTVDDIRLAGAFGAHINPVHAMVLGLIPDCEVDKVTSVGNAAGSGAVRALLSGRERVLMEDVIAGVTKIETATEPRFQELFVAAMAFPHLTASTDHLATVVQLPERVAQTDQPRRRRRKRTSNG